MNDRIIELAKQAGFVGFDGKTKVLQRFAELVRAEALEEAAVEHAGKVFHAKFNIGEHVWLMKNNKPIEVVISAIEVFYVNTNQDRITYNAKDVVNSVSWLDHTKLQETLLFRSKVELLEAL